MKRITLDLGRARFLLKESNESSPEVSFFLGRQKVDGIDTPFVNSYVDLDRYPLWFVVYMVTIRGRRRDAKRVERARAFRTAYA